MKRIIALAFMFSLIIIVGSSSSFSKADLGVSYSNVPPSTQIILTNDGALHGTGYWYWYPPIQGYRFALYPYRQVKVVFAGSRWSDGQNVTDPNCPIIDQSYGYSSCIESLANFYYLDGGVSIYSRPSSSDSWTYDGSMLMSSSNCTMDGSKVLNFTVDCGYLNAE